MIVTGTYSPTAEDIIHSVEVDLVDRQMISEPIHVVQYDKQLPVLEVKLWKNTQPYSVPTGCEVNVRYEKPDGTVVYNNVLGLSSNRQVVYVQISQQMTMAYGKADAVIEIKTSAGKIAATATIVFDIERNPVQEDAIESSSEFKALESYVSDAASSAAKAKVSETNAKDSETKAKTSETNAKSSETKAKTSETNAKDSETKAKTSETNAKDSETKAKTSETNAKDSETKAKASEDAALVSQNAAKASETNAKDSETKAKKSEDNAKESEAYADMYASNAKASEQAAAGSALSANTSKTAAAASQSAAKTSENNARTYAQNAETASSNATEKADAADAYATEAESWAHGGTGTREGEDEDNAQAYYEQAKRIVQNFNGLVPMGTIPFSELSNEENQYPSYMFNISDAFTSDTRFKDGGGIYYGAGNNVIFTADGKWDVLASSGVTGVKGGAETSYRQGNVNLTAKNVGAIGVAIELTNENLNDLRSVNQQGIYYAGGGNAVTNKPSGVNAFAMFILRSGAGVVSQVLICSSTADGYVWRRYFDGTNFGAWQQLPYGVKGANESSYRGGNVNLTAENVGAFPEATDLPNGADLNTYTTPGIFEGGSGGNYKNVAIENVSFTLVVLSTKQGYTRQIFSNITNGNTFYTRQTTTGEWSVWVKLPFGIKGNLETEYRGGNVNLTPENIGAVPYYNSTTVVTNTDWDAITNPGSYRVENASMDETHHAPVGVYGYGILICIWGDDLNTNKSYTQIYFPTTYANGSNAEIWFRTRNWNSWRPWSCVLSKNLMDSTYVKKSGDTMTGNLTLDGIGTFKRSTGQGAYRGVHGTLGWVIISQIKINSSYVNYPFELEISGRNKNFGTVLSILFNGIATNDPDLDSFQQYGGTGNIFRIKKISTSIWQLVAKKIDNYGDVFVMRAHSLVDFNGGGGLEITYPNAMLSGEPDDTWIAPTLGGEIGKANQLTDSRNIAIAGAVTGTASFNGTADATITALRRGVMVGNETTSELWFKIASYTGSTINTDKIISFKVNRTYHSGSENDFGILTARYRSNSTGVITNATLTWEIAGTNVVLSNYVLCYNNVSPHIIEIWVKITTRYRWYDFTVLLEGNRNTIYSGWTLYNDPTGVSAPTAGYTQVVSSLGTLINPVSNLTIDRAAGGTAYFPFLVNHNLKVATIDASQLSYSPDNKVLKLNKTAVLNDENQDTYSILVYDYGNYNFCAMGCDDNGDFHVRTGNSKTTKRSFVFGVDGKFTSPIDIKSTNYKFTNNENSKLWAEAGGSIWAYCSGFSVKTLTGTWGIVNAASFTTQSSRRYKENIEPMTKEEAEKILSIQPVTFDYIGESNYKDCRGVIAEDTYKLIPSVVGLDSDGNPDSVDYSKFVPYLIKMVQMQQKEIEELKEEIQNLKRR